MEKELLQFDVFADAKAKKTEIRRNIFMSVVLSALTLYVLFPLDRFGLYSRGSAETVYVDGTPAIVMSLLSAALFGWIAYIFIKQLPELQNEMNEEPMLYSFNEVGFTSHISGETHEWDDFKTFYYGQAGLHLPYKKKRGTSFVLGLLAFLVSHTCEYKIILGGVRPRSFHEKFKLFLPLCDKPACARVGGSSSPAVRVLAVRV